MRLVFLVLVAAFASPSVVAASELLLADKPAPATTAVDPSSAGDGGNRDAPVAETKPFKAGKPVIYPRIYDAPILGKLDGGEIKVDESALRFYASQKNHQRVDAEIRRLKTLYANWKVPANLYAPAGSGNDEQPFWDLFAANKINELRAAISLRELQEANWHPSADLSEKIERRDARNSLTEVSDARNWLAVLDIANRLPAMLNCGAVDVDWRVAEAFVQTNESNRAFEILHGILSTCTNRDERIATARKAVNLLPADDAKTILAMGKPLPDGSSEFDPVRFDLVRAQIGAEASGKSTAPIDPEAFAGFLEGTLRSRNLADATLLGWNFFAKKKWTDADEWFRFGLSIAPDDAKLSEGHVLSLRNLGHEDEAAKLAYQWRDRSASLRAIYMGTLVAQLTHELPAPEVDPAVLADFTSFATDDKSSDAAQALAWYYTNRKNWGEGVSWFKYAVDWAVAAKTEAALPDKTVEGYARDLVQLGRSEEAEALAYQWRDRGPTIRALYISIVSDALNQTDPVLIIAPERTARFAEVVTSERSALGAGALAWRNFRDNDVASAVDWFTSAIAWSPDQKGDAKINEGLALALRGAHRYAEAEEVAYTWRSASPLMRDLYRSIMAVELTQTDLAASVTEPRVARFAEAVDADRLFEGAQAIGWYRLQSQGCGYAVGWFRKAFAWSPEGKGDPKIAEGYARALQAVGHNNEAEDVAFDWRDRSPDMKTLFITIGVAVLTSEAPVPHMPENRLTRFAAIVDTERSSNGAQALAWYRYGDHDCGYGAQWFASTLQWSPELRGDSKINEGFALALRSIGYLSQSEAVLYPWVSRVPRMKDLYMGVVVSELTRDNPPMPMDEARLTAFANVITPIRSALGAQAIAWYRIARHENKEAVTWFRMATDWWPAVASGSGEQAPVLDDYRPLQTTLALTLPDYRRSPRAFALLSQDATQSGDAYVNSFEGLSRTWYGYALALRDAGRAGDAEAVTYEWRDRSPLMRALFIDLSISRLAQTPPGAMLAADQLKRVTSLVESDRSAAGAQALGWYNTARKQWTEAAVWFKAAMDWQAAGTAPDSAVDTKPVEGYVNALRNLNRADEAMAVILQWRDRVPALKALYFATAIDQLRAAAPGDPVPAERLAELAAYATDSKAPSDATALGWYFYGQKMNDQALSWFKQAITGAKDNTVDPKAAQGFTLTLRALGRGADALTFVSAWRDRLPDLNALVPDIVVDLLGKDNSGVALPPDTLARISGFVSELKSSPGASALGWTMLNQKDYAASVEWFKAALAWSADGKGDIKMAEGLSLALRGLGRYDEAEDSASAWLDAKDNTGVRTAYIDAMAEAMAKTKPTPVLDEAGLQRFATAIVAAQSGNGAQALGWYSFNAAQYAPAIAWFDKAIAWDPREGTALGLALSYRKSGDLDGMNRVIAAYGARFPNLSDLIKKGGGKPAEPPRNAATLMRPAPASRRSTPVASDDAAPPRATSSAASGSAAAALQAKDFSRCVSIVSSNEKAGRAGADLEQIKGWCLLGLDRPQEASLSFSRALSGEQGKKREDSAYGQSLSLLRSGATSEAAAAAAQAPLSNERRSDIGLQVLSQQASAAYDAGRWTDAIGALNRRASYAPETRDLMMMRGWSLYHLYDYDGAHRAFSAVDQQLSDRDSQRALATVDSRLSPRGP